MKKLKKFDVYYSGGSCIDTITDTCITKACKQYIKDHNLEAKVITSGREYATIRLTTNHYMDNDYVVMMV